MAAKNKSRNAQAAARKAAPARVSAKAAIPKPKPATGKPAAPKKPPPAKPAAAKKSAAKPAAGKTKMPPPKAAKPAPKVAAKPKRPAKPVAKPKSKPAAPATIIAAALVTPPPPVRPPVARPPVRPLVQAHGVVKAAAPRVAVTEALLERLPPGVQLVGPLKPGYEQILTPEALAFLADLERRFGPRRIELLKLREKRQQRLDRGEKPDFLAETAEIRDGDWKVAPLPRDLIDRRVEITGPTDRKMIINALNSGAKVFMADFEDCAAPFWRNLIDGQINLRDAVRGQIRHDDPATGRLYRLNSEHAVLMVRPRGWHLDEAHVLVDGKPLAATLFDFGLYLFHNHKRLISRGSGPYFYLPKLESHLEARLWNDVFVHAQSVLGIERGRIRATVLIETITAAFEMDEILWELRDHAAGLNCGRWDYIFSYIKKFAEDPQCLLPDRAQITMAVPMMRALSQLLIKTCHRREVHAIGGMAAQIPIKDDAVANGMAMVKVRADKEREASEGYDGTWIAHPGLVPIARVEFEKVAKGPNQIARKRQDVNVAAADLLTPPAGVATEVGLRLNLTIGIAYLEAWMRGIGCVPLYNLMEDVATAEISRAQIWQQLRHGARLDDGTKVTKPLVRQLMKEELARIERLVGPDRFARGKYGDASKILRDLIEAEHFVEFLTLPAYQWLMKQSSNNAKS